MTVMGIEKVEAWRTSDGEYHSGPKMAEQHIRNKRLVDDLKEYMSDGKADAQDIVNLIGSRRQEWLLYFAACDAMEKEVMGT